MGENFKAVYHPKVVSHRFIISILYDSHFFLKNCKKVLRDLMHDVTGQQFHAKGNPMLIMTPTQMRAPAFSPKIT